MKILKLKSILFSLMAVVMVTVFLTSCEEDKLPVPTNDIQKNEIPAAAQSLIEEDRGIPFKLPAKFNDADQETIDLYLANITTEQVKEMQDSYKVEKYLESIGRLEEVYKDLGQTDMLALSDLSKYTSEQELADFNSFDVNSVIESRNDWGCVPGYFCRYLGPWKGYEIYRFEEWINCCSPNRRPQCKWHLVEAYKLHHGGC